MRKLDMSKDIYAYGQPDILSDTHIRFLCAGITHDDGPEEWIQGYYSPDMLERTHGESVKSGYLTVFDYENAETKLVRVWKNSVCRNTCRTANKSIRNEIFGKHYIFENDMLKITTNFDDNKQPEISYHVWEDIREYPRTMPYESCIDEIEIIGNVIDSPKLLDKCANKKQWLWRKGGIRRE